MLRLNQVIAVEKQLKQKLNTEGSEIHKSNQKAELFSGITRTYETLQDGDEVLPNESKKVQANAEDSIKAMTDLWSELLGVVATKDIGNALAKATIPGVETPLPVTYLIWLEKQLHDHRTFILSLPVLGSDRNWTKDQNTGFWATEVVRTARSKKISKVITKAPATDKHPAQAELVSEDVLAGYWNTQGLSGAISPTRKKELLDRVDRFLKDVKQAREEANSIKIESFDQIGRQIADYLTK